MYENMKIQLFVNVLRELEKIYPDNTFTIEGDTIKDDCISITIKGDGDNKVSIKIEGVETGFLLEETVAWFVFYKETDSTILDLLEKFNDVSITITNNIIMGIKSILNSKYDVEPISYIHRELSHILKYILLPGVELSVTTEDGSHIEFNLKVQDFTNVMTFKTKDFNPNMLVESVIPMFQIMINDFQSG